MVKKLNGLFSGPLLGVFVLAFFSRRARTMPVLIGAALGTGLAGWLTSSSQVGRLPAWLTATGTISPMWFCVIGFIITWIVGYFGSLLGAMVTRVTQGHSGRPLQLGRVAGFAFVVVQVVALLRIGAELSRDPFAWQALAAFGWLFAFLPWVLRSAWIYLTPRADGREG